MIEITPTVSNGVAYTANDAVGGKNTISNFFQYTGQYARLTNFVILDKDAQNVVYQIFLFNDDYTEPADNAAFSVSDADMLKMMGCVLTATGTNNISLSGNLIVASGQASLLPVLVKSATANLYVQLRTTGTPTYTSTSALTVRLFFEME